MTKHLPRSTNLCEAIPFWSLHRLKFTLHKLTRHFGLWRRARLFWWLLFSEVSRLISWLPWCITIRDGSNLVRNWIRNLNIHICSNLLTISPNKQYHDLNWIFADTTLVNFWNFRCCLQTDQWHDLILDGSNNSNRKRRERNEWFVRKLAGVKMTEWTAQIMTVTAMTVV